MRTARYFRTYTDTCNRRTNAALTAIYKLAIYAGDGAKSLGARLNFTTMDCRLYTLYAWQFCHSFRRVRVKSELLAINYV